MFSTLQLNKFRLYIKFQAPLVKSSYSLLIVIENKEKFFHLVEYVGVI